MNVTAAPSLADRMIERLTEVAPDLASFLGMFEGNLRSLSDAELKAFLRQARSFFDELLEG